ncbi:MAG: hypothetical protein ACKOAF_02170 [Actinomycetes bacterium]
MMSVVGNLERVAKSRRWPRATLPLVVATFSAIFLVANGVTIRTVVGVMLAVSFQALGGALVWRKLRPSADLLESSGMGIALGTGLSVISGLLIRVLFDAAWGWLVPSVAVLISWLAGRLRAKRASRASRTPTLDRATLIALVVGAVVGVTSLVGNIRHYPLVWRGTWSGYHTDMPFFEALSTSLAKFGPLDSIFLPGAEVRYHWLVYAWSGQVSQAVGAEGFVMLTRGLQVTAVLASSLLVVSWTRRLTRRMLTPTLAVLLLLTGGYIGVTYGGILNFDSPSQSMGVAWLLAASLALMEFVRSSEERSRRAQVAWLSVIAALGFITTGGKISAAAPLLVGAVLMTGFGLLMRADWRRRALQGTVALCCGSLLAYVLIISGANGGGGLALGALIDRTSSQQGINPIEGTLGIILGTCILVLAVAMRWSGLFWLATRGESRSRPDVIFALGMAVTGLGAIILFNGFNEIWFAAAASAPLAVFTAEGFESALDRLTEVGRRSLRSVLVAAIVAAVVIFAIVWIVWATGPSGGSYWRGTWRWSGPIVAFLLGIAAGWTISRFAGSPYSRTRVLAATTLVLVLVALPSRLLGIGTGQVGVPAGLRPDLFSMGIAPTVRGHDELLISDIPWGYMEAAAWLRGHASATDVVATNLTFGPLIPAITGLQTFVSGIQYQAPYGRPAAAAEVLKRDDEIWKFVNSPSAETLAPLCASGVTWIWVNPEAASLTSWLPYATVAFTNADATILGLAPENCPAS